MNHMFTREKIMFEKIFILNFSHSCNKRISSSNLHFSQLKYCSAGSFPNRTNAKQVQKQERIYLLSCCINLKLFSFWLLFQHRNQNYKQSNQLNLSVCKLKTLNYFRQISLTKNAIFYNKKSENFISNYNCSNFLWSVVLGIDIYFQNLIKFYRFKSLWIQL